MKICIPALPLLHITCVQEQKSDIFRRILCALRMLQRSCAYHVIASDCEGHELNNEKRTTQRTLVTANHTREAAAVEARLPVVASVTCPTQSLHFKGAVTFSSMLY